nr:hypothetical protein [Tanacetum cinerariifolium]
MFSLSGPASKLETIKKASLGLSSLERDACPSATGERALDLAIRIALLVNLLGVNGVPEERVCDGAQLGPICHGLLRRLCRLGFVYDPRSDYTSSPAVERTSAGETLADAPPLDKIFAASIELNWYRVPSIHVFFVAYCPHQHQEKEPLVMIHAGKAEVLAMFSLSGPASKLETVEKASLCLSSLKRDVGPSATGERALDLAIRIALLVNLLRVRVSVGA